jgi:hypothetical protein
MRFSYVNLPMSIMNTPSPRVITCMRYQRVIVQTSKGYIIDIRGL